MFLVGPATSHVRQVLERHFGDWHESKRARRRVAPASDLLGTCRRPYLSDTSYWFLGSCGPWPKEGTACFA